MEDLGLEDPQSLFEKGEWTWDNFDKICDTLKENGKSGMIQSGAVSYTHLFAEICPAAELLYGSTGTAHRPESKGKDPLFSSSSERVKLKLIAF